MTYFEQDYPARAYDAYGKHIGMGPWIKVVWAANDIEKDFFATPTYPTGPWVEVYKHATVQHYELADVVTVRSRDEHGAQVLEQAHTAMVAAEPA